MHTYICINVYEGKERETGIIERDKKKKREFRKGLKKKELQTLFLSKSKVGYIRGVIKQVRIIMMNQRTFLVI